MTMNKIQAVYTTVNIQQTLQSTKLINPNLLLYFFYSYIRSLCMLNISTNFQTNATIPASFRAFEPIDSMQTTPIGRRPKF